MFNNPFREYRERKRREREQALENQRRLLYEAQRRAKRKWGLILLYLRPVC